MTAHRTPIASQKTALGAMEGLRVENGLRFALLLATLGSHGWAYVRDR